MKTLYFDCSMGVAGDMLVAALLELTEDSDAAVEKLNAMGLPGVTFEAKTINKCGIKATQMHVTAFGVEEGEEVCELLHHYEAHSGDVAEHHGAHSEEGHGHSHHHEAHSGEEQYHGVHSAEEHHHWAHSEEGHEHSHAAHQHRSLQDVEDIILALSVSDSVKKNAIAVYEKIAEAESTAHGTSVSEIHFHEVGMLDAIADILAVCYLLEELHPVHIYASPIHVGSGTVKAAHGILPVPAPATAYLLQNIPSYSDGIIQAELTTPTGAALLAYFVEDFQSQPMMCVNRIGYGGGKRDFARANILRAFLGEMSEPREPSASGKMSGSGEMSVAREPSKLGGMGVQKETAEFGESDTSTIIYELSCNLDDMTGEEISFAIEKLFAAGALDVYTTNISMKKNRPAVKLSVLCRAEQREEMRRLLFMHTSTLGVRQQSFERFELEREFKEMKTSYGVVRKKCATGYGISKEKYEYEDLARIAKEQNLSIRDVREILLKEEGTSSCNHF